MANTNSQIPNVMPDALVEPITDMELTVAKLQQDGELNKHAKGNVHANKKYKEV